ncbi:TetR/AcrR family transcriptional regulator [Vagococcus sp. BWB3-3]|uniref:TetR/AcrR family transcriptional regulator n=1 Tax=Vagococcus allomyrinae TaxID=2794353 RepID=A0A940PDP6_9ENTE|nr:TetR/AcrR family transcriptional regulator [Vagococcus allomyrinae]MBP1042925.1 TetR/AcrR family transcriptional regulator [Vagococcus allomyrinae]
MKRAKRNNEETKHALLHAALNVFSEVGYENARLEDIALAAELSRGAIYHNFGGKSEIFKELIAQYGITADQVISDIYRSEETATQNIERFVSSSLDFLVSNENYRKIAILTSFNLKATAELKDVCEVLEHDTQQYLIYLSSLVQKGVDNGEFASQLSVEITAMSILSQVNGLSNLWLAYPDIVPLREKATMFSEVIIKGLKK